MLLMIAQAEPPPSGWERGADYVVKHAEARPDVLFPLLSTIGFLGLIVGAGFVFVRYALPAWRAEKQADREHLSALVTQRGKEALEDVAAGRELAKVQHSAIVTAIGDRVDRVTGEIARLVERSEKHGDLLRSVASKVGVGLLLVVLAAGVVMAARHSIVSANECPKGCPAGHHCCSRDGLCCPNDKATAVKPTSALLADCSHDFREDSSCE